MLLSFTVLIEGTFVSTGYGSDLIVNSAESYAGCRLVLAAFGFKRMLKPDIAFHDVKAVSTNLNACNWNIANTPLVEPP
jgi:hypothetical protein